MDIKSFDFTHIQIYFVVYRVYIKLIKDLLNAKQL